MKRQQLSQLRKCCLLFCASIAFIFTGFQAGNSQEKLPTKVPPATSPKSKTTEVQDRENTPLPSKRYSLSVDISKTIYDLPAIDLSNITKKPNQIGVNRAMNLFMKSTSKQYGNSDGSKIMILSIRSPGAIGVRAHIEDFDIPEGDEVYIYGTASDSQVQGPYSGKGPWKDKQFWSGTVDGDTVIIEYYAKNGARNFRISEVTHVFADLNSTVSPNILSCEVDASCSSDSEKNAVGRIVFQKPDGSYVCSGTLLNDRNSSFTPYFLTANHCVSTQSAAQTVEVYWFYQTTSCNSGILRSDIYHSISGSNLLVTSQSADSTLIRFLGTMPGGLRYSGWDPNPKSNGTSVFGLHHPGNGTPPSTTSYLRRSAGSIISTASSCSASGLTNGFQINWISGITEPGSSGSGLWYTSEGNNYLIGVDSCGPINVDCAYNGNSYALYGKFSDFYPLIQSYIDSSASGPANNNFANAEVISGNIGSTTGSNIGATKEAGEPDHAGNTGGTSLWYQWQAPSNGSVTITTTGSSFDTLLGVYTGSSVSSLATIASNDDGGSGVTSRVTFNVVGGTTYRIAVDGFNGATGNVVLNWTTGSPIANDNFANAQVVSGSSGNVNSTNVGATKEAGEPNHGGNSGSASVWYQWQAPSNGSVTITTTGSSFDTLLGVYTGSSVSSLATIASNDDDVAAAVLTSKVTFNAVGGTIYRIAVDGFGNATGNITLNWNLQGPTCSYSISPSAQSFTSGGGTGSISVTAGTGCAWSASSNATWIIISSGSSGSGNGSVGYTVSANTGASSRSGTITVSSGQGFTATYTVNQSAPVSLTVASSNPASGVSIAVSPNDINGLGNGTTPFTHTYHNNTVVSLTAPSTAGGNNFQKWQRGGVDFSLSQSINVTMDANYTVTAVYVNPCPSVSGMTPASGMVGSNVTITGNGFNGVTAVRFSNNISAGFTVNSNTQITATVPNGAVSGPITISKTTCNDVQTSTFTVSPPIVQVTVQTNPSGRSFIVDGNTYTTQQTFSWTSGTSHSISTTSTQGGSVGTQYVWSGWSDGGAISHNVVAPASNATYTANFNTQYFLTMNAGTGGSVTPPSNWFGSGQSVSISATPDSGFNFTGWSGIGTGAYTGSNSPTTVVMNGPITETASFTTIPLRLDSVSPVAGRTSGGQQIKLSGAFAGLLKVMLGGTQSTWSYSNGNTEIIVTTPAHAVGAVAIDLVPSSGNIVTRATAFAYLTTVFTDNQLFVGVTTAKAQHILELRRAVDALRAVAGLQAAQWTDPGLSVGAQIKAVHIQELRSYLEAAAIQLGYAPVQYTDPSLGAVSIIKRVHIEELRQRIRAIAG